MRSQRMARWVFARVGPQARKLMVELGEDGATRLCIDKRVRASLLDLDSDEVPDDAREVIQCADDIWSSSVAKFKRMADMADFDDDRARGAFVFAGGSATGRAASYGIQVHNLTRKCADDPEAVRAAMVSGQTLVPDYGKTVNDVLKGMLRPAIMPAPGKVFVVADWSAIEGRVNPWLSCHETKEEVLNVFRNGEDLYIRQAMKIYKCDETAIDKAKRQIGKVAVLALGYQGSVGAFQALAKAYGVAMSEREVLNIVSAWREANQWAVKMWSGLEGAAKRAMRNPGKELTYGKITYMFDGTHLWYALPSGRILCYPFAKMGEDGVSYAKAAWKPAAGASEWPRAQLYGGLQCENTVQAVANDILRYALRELDDLYYDIVMHVHDEIVVEVDESKADQCLKDMTRIMTTPPSWAEGLPLAVESSTLTRYGK